MGLHSIKNPAGTQVSKLSSWMMDSSRTGVYFNWKCSHVAIGTGSVGGGSLAVRGPCPPRLSHTLVTVFFIFFQVSLSSIEYLWCSCYSDKQRG